MTSWMMHSAAQRTTAVAAPNQESAPSSCGCVDLSLPPVNIGVSCDRPLVDMAASVRTPSLLGRLALSTAAAALLAVLAAAAVVGATELRGSVSISGSNVVIDPALSGVVSATAPLRLGGRAVFGTAQFDASLVSATLSSISSAENLVASMGTTLRNLQRRFSRVRIDGRVPLPEGALPERDDDEYYFGVVRTDVLQPANGTVTLLVVCSWVLERCDLIDYTREGELTDTIDDAIEALPYFFKDNTGRTLLAVSSMVSQYDFKLLVYAVNISSAGSAASMLTVVYNSTQSDSTQVMGLVKIARFFTVGTDVYAVGLVREAVVDGSAVRTTTSHVRVCVCVCVCVSVSVCVCVCMCVCVCV
jgi:hypothetical protein